MFHKLTSYLVGLISDDGVVTALNGEGAGRFFPIVIVPRAYYRESVAQYPIDSKKELSKILSHQNPDADSIVLTEMVANTEGDGYWVKQYIIDESLFPSALYSPLVMLPESLLREKTVRDKEIMSVSNPEPYFIFQNGAKHISALKSGNISSPHLFAVAVGASDELVASDIIENSLIDKTNIKQVLAILVRSSWTFLPLSSEKIKHWIVRPLGYLWLLFTLYLLIGTGYLWWKKEQYETVKIEQRDMLNEAFSRQSEIDGIVGNVQILSEVSNEIELTSPVWQVIRPLIGMDVRVDLLSYNRKRFTLIGTGLSATHALDNVQKNELVESAQFNTPVSRRGAREQFSIIFSLSQEKAQRD